MITLTTDFGPDFYVAEMKGVILSIKEDAQIVDVTHSISKYNIAEGAFVISRIWNYFPKGTIHIGVVDPGVGSARKPIAIKTDNCLFIGPDNGLFSLALKDQGIEEIVEIDAERVIELAKLSSISRTFHGRDMFAPAAALVAGGIELEMIGKKVERIENLEFVENSVIYIDSFGNIITSLNNDFKSGDELILLAGGKESPVKFVDTFSDVPEGQLCVLRGSHGFLEIDVNMGSAAKKINVGLGDKVTLKKC